MSEQLDKTKVDDLLLEMIQPKVHEIEAKFSRGEGLSNEDINTLLLKSQYNHINHLDQKLNEVTASVIDLKLEFSGVKTDFCGLKTDFAQHQTEIQKMINASMRWYIASISLIVIGLKLLDLLISR